MLGRLPGHPLAIVQALPGDGQRLAEQAFRFVVPASNLDDHRQHIQTESVKRILAAEFQGRSRRGGEEHRSAGGGGAPKFFPKSGCISCHNVSIPLMAATGWPAIALVPVAEQVQVRAAR
jgi:hypothetical protein